MYWWNNRTVNRSNQQKEVSDEEIFNVYRRAEKPFLKTGDVVKELPIGERAVQLRLDQLEEEGRLESEFVGRALIRWLDDEEPKEIVWEGDARYFRWSNRMKNVSFDLRRWGIWLFAGSGFLMLLLIAVELNLDPYIPFSRQHLTLGIAGLLYFGSMFLLAWGLFRCAGYLLRYAGERRLGKHKG